MEAKHMKRCAVGGARKGPGERDLLSPLPGVVCHTSCVDGVYQHITMNPMLLKCLWRLE